MSYRYNSTDKDKFSLHDCRSDHIELEDGRLTFFFPSGIFCTDYGDDWPNTSAASLEYNVDSMRGITFYAFRETGGQTVREECQLPTTEVAGLYLPGGQRLTPPTFGFK